MRRFAEVAGIVAWRTLHNFFANPAFLAPALVFPLFFFVAFAGGLSSVGDVPGFDYEPGYTAFQFVFVLLQASAFGGVFTGLSIAADFEFGFARRLMLGAPNRLAILAGYASAALARAVLVGTLLFAVALASGMQVSGGPVDLAGLIILALGVALAATLFGAGVAFRLQTVQAGPALQTPVFLVLFIAPVFVPHDLLTGWIDAAAGLNPITPILENGRGLLAGDAPEGLAFGLAAALVVVMGTWAVRGLRRAERAA